MTQWEKLIERLKRRPSDMDYADVERLLEGFGYTMRRASRHTAVFSKPGERKITVPTVKGRKVKGVYLDEIRSILGLDN